MGIGTSQGAYYDDGHHRAAAEWDNKYDDNVLTPGQVETNKQLNQVEETELGGIEVGMQIPQNAMPYPNNQNPDSDFNSRFGNLPPAGIMNDLKPKIEDKPLLRRISDVQEEDGNDFSGIGNTPIGSDLSPEVKKYQDWLSKNNLRDTDRYDYDMQGAYMAGIQPSENGHLPDTYKKPNHMTFSDESIFHGGTMTFKDSPDYIAEGGHWEKLEGEDKKYSFTPGKSNLDYHTPEDMIDYFKKNEPDSRLILPGQ